jgi:Xaa-Pro aminopeptidase
MGQDYQKQARIQEIMAAQDLDVIIARYTENVLYFTNVWPITGWGVAAVFKGKDTTVFIPDSEMDFTGRAIVGDIRPCSDMSLAGIARCLEQLEIPAGARIGVELTKEDLASSHLGYEVAFPNKPTFDMIASTFDSCTVVDATPAIDDMRQAKTDFEIAQLKMVNTLTTRGLAAAGEMLQDGEGLTEMEIATTCEKAINDSIVDYPNVDFVRAFAFVMAGPNGIKAPRPFNISSGYRCKNGELVMLELNTQVNGYWSDLTRTWVCGRQPTDEQVAMQDAVNAGIQAALDAMLPGATWLGAFRAMRESIAATPFAKYNTPFLGHGIGCKLHETLPIMHDAVNPADKFISGHCCSVEPGLYLEKMGALRFERNVAIKENGPVILDEYPCAL